MKYIHYFLISLVFAFSSCDSFLEEKAEGRLTPNSLYQDVEGLDMALTGLYNQYVQTNRYVFRAIHAWCGDDITAQNAGNKTRFAEYDMFNFNSGNTEVLDQYKAYYSTIKACNNIINNAEGMTIDQTVLNSRLGQAYFLRALNYFMLVRIWGRLPLVTAVEIDYASPRASVEDIYELILSDALKAEEMLPLNHTVSPYFKEGINVAPNKAAAKALVASIYLTQAGWPLKKGTEFYDRAAAKYKEIIDNEGQEGYNYILEPDIRTLVDEPESNYSKEIIFGEFHHVNNNNYAGPFTELPEESTGWCDLIVELEFFDNFPEGPRKDAWFLTKISMTGREKDPVTDLYPLLDWSDPGTNQKHPHWKKNIQNGAWDYDYETGYYTAAGLQGGSSKTRYIFRYADILLLYAEAVAFGSGGVTPLALDCVHRVQTRAGAPLTPSSVSKETFQQAVLAERRWETSGMEHSCMGRFFTMQRHEILHLQKNYRSPNDLPLNNGLSLSEQYYYFPIPDAELLIVPDLNSR
ncbi:MAG: RagB/SusD family nutrient uptake outer membrane protein [Tannerellaceae bacterium]|jgi:hypothetical protein|nr:RagB/SusD family nutrient uptake outer membrane protein [Tannerellaceae bacterium]